MIKRKKNLLIACFCCSILFIYGCLSVPVASAQDENMIMESFERFGHDWMAKLSQTNDRNRENVRLVSSKGWYTGQYVCYGSQCRMTIKKTLSPKTPYIGFLSYSEMHVQKAGRTVTPAMEDPGRIYNEIPVTEIFRYTHNEWVY